MSSAIESEIQKDLLRYLEDEITLQEFEDNFLPILWDLGESPDESARVLAGRVSNLISEYSDGYRTLDSLREELGQAIHHPLTVHNDNALK